MTLSQDDAQALFARLQALPDARAKRGMRHQQRSLRAIILCATARRRPRPAPSNGWPLTGATGVSRTNCTMTPYEKLKSLPEAASYLKPGVTFEQLGKESTAMTDNEAAALFTLQRNKIFSKIFKQTQSKNWPESLSLRLISLLENTGIATSGVRFKLMWRNSNSR